MLKIFLKNIFFFINMKIWILTHSIVLRLHELYTRKYIWEYMRTRLKNYEWPNGMARSGSNNL